MPFLSCTKQPHNKFNGVDLKLIGFEKWIALKAPIPSVEHSTVTPAKPRNKVKQRRKVSERNLQPPKNAKQSETWVLDLEGGYERG